jgi:hypothetical protein
MKREIRLWIIALIITLATAIIQRKTGPTYPISDTFEVDGIALDYEFERTHSGASDQPVIINIPDTSFSGFLVWRRYKSNDAWSRVALDRAGEDLVAALPHQPPAGKIEYHLELSRREQHFLVPADENIVTRFKGDVPATVLIPHILFMFVGMLVSTRAGLEALCSTDHLKFYALWTTGLLFFGGLVLGPMVQKFAFDSYWTGFPFGFDLTDNKTLLAQVVWIIALIVVFSKSRARWWVVAASTLTLIIFLIPHSLHGSELDYSKIETEKQRVQSGL